MGSKQFIDKLVDTVPDQVKLAWGRNTYGPRNHPETGQPEVEEAVAVIEFSQKGFGWGELTLVQKGDKLFIDAETMSRPKVLELLAMMVRDAILDSEEDPVLAATYSEVMRKKPPESPKSAVEDMRWLVGALVELRDEAECTDRGPWVIERINQLIRELS